jgi:hypothetical protein
MSDPGAMPRRAHTAPANPFHKPGAHMRRWVIALILAATAGGLLLAHHVLLAQVGQPPTPPPPAPLDKGAEVPVRTVVLFSSGVGYFEHFGAVRGNGSTELRFKTQQVNDILKSLILEDTDGGLVTAITYPSLAPLARTLHSFEVDISDNPGLGDLLNQLRGARVKVVIGAGETESGTILGLEWKEKGQGMGVISNVCYLNLLQGSSLRAIELDSVRKVDLEDGKLQQELTRALAALAQARDQDKKHHQLQRQRRAARSHRLRRRNPGVEDQLSPTDGPR